MKEKIYISKQEYIDYLKEIKVMTDKLKKVISDKEEISLNYENVKSTELEITRNLQELYDKLSRFEIIEDTEDDVINIGDIVTAEFIYTPDDIMEETFELVSMAKSNDKLVDNNIEQVSVDSPVGKAIYRKKVGDTCSCLLSGENVSIFIKSKDKVLSKNLVK